MMKHSSRQFGYLFLGFGHQSEKFSRIGACIRHNFIPCCSLAMPKFSLASFAWFWLVGPWKKEVKEVNLSVSFSQCVLLMMYIYFQVWTTFPRKISFPIWFPMHFPVQSTMNCLIAFCILNLEEVQCNLNENCLSMDCACTSYGHWLVLLL